MKKIKELILKFKRLKLWQKLGFISLFTGFLLFLAILFLFLSVKWSIIGDIPSREELIAINNPLSTNLYSSDGKLFGKFYDENRGELYPEDLTEDYKNALLATEDVRFYQHNGVDYRALGRVAIKSILLQRDNSGGGSTLTQQLTKNIYKRQKFWALSLVINKFREIATAQKLEKVYSKAELLLLYSNTVSFGERAFGLSTASYRFFGKEPYELNLQESATLVGILKAPSYYSPKRHPDRCKSRRNVVISQMEKYNFISPEAADSARNSELTLDYHSLAQTTGLARYFHQFVKDEFDLWAKANPKENGDVYDIKRDGLKIYTTLDYNMQIAAEQSMEKHMKALQKIFDKSWVRGNKYGSQDVLYRTEIKKSKRYKDLKDQGKSEQEILIIFRETSAGDLWYWDENKTAETVEDSIKYYLGQLHAGILAAEPQTGSVKAYVGGIDFGAFQYDNVRSARQVGSTFKPIVYLTAIERGVSECDYFPNELRTYASYKDWTPENSDGKYGGYLSVIEALSRSVNTVSVQMIFAAGIDNSVKKAKELGISANLPEVPSLVLGTADISLFDMVKAYCAIANGGTSPPLKGIDRIETADGKILFENKQNMEHTDHPDYQSLYNVLAGVTRKGTASRIYNYNIPFEVIGKTGTTQNQTDGWFIGMTKDLVIGAWVGAQNRGVHFRNLGTGSGGRTALPLVASLYEYAGNTGYNPRPLVSDSIYACPDSIGQEEFDYLVANPGDIDGLMAMRRGTNGRIFDDILGRDQVSYPDDKIVINRPSRKGRRTSTKSKSDFDKFKSKVEKDLRKIFKTKKRRRRKN